MLRTDFIKLLVIKRNTFNHEGVEGVLPTIDKLAYSKASIDEPGKK